MKSLRSRLLAALSACIAGSLLVAEDKEAGPPVGGIGPATAEGARSVTVDKAKEEIRIPCLFVNPTRVIEVFACHKTGPTHETVVQFDVTGPEIYRALLEIGARPATYWNGTSPDDFLRNQGDRLLLSLRWTYKGQEHECPAEALLLDGSTGLPMFVRGFSLSARPQPAPAPEEDVPPPGEAGAEKEGKPASAGRAVGEAPGGPAGGIPKAVEITLGASKRQSAIYSLLSHPTNLPRVVPWMQPPEIDQEKIPEHEKLVEEEVPATLAIRRVRSEVEFLELDRQVALEAGLEDRLAQHERLLPVAREIDRLKAEYEKLLRDFRDFLTGSPDTEKASEEEKTARAKRGLGFLRRGMWLCSRIEELYLKLYWIQEESKAAWVEARTDLPDELREEVLVLARDGFSFEPRLAAKEAEIAALDLPEADLPAEAKTLRRQILVKQIEIFRLERDRRLAEANLRYTVKRLGALPATDEYLKRLFLEDKLRFEIAIRSLQAKDLIARTELSESEARLEGRWDAARSGILKERSLGSLRLAAARIEEEILQVMEQIRWAENDRDSDVVERQEKATAELDQLSRKKTELEARLAEARKKVEEAK